MEYEPQQTENILTTVYPVTPTWQGRAGSDPGTAAERPPGTQPRQLEVLPLSIYHHLR